MRIKGNKILHSLTFKIVLVACVIIIPINILLIMTANQMIENVERELINSYQNSLSIYVADLDNGLDAMKINMEEIMLGNYPELKPGYNSGQQGIATFEFWKTLKTKRENSKYTDIAFLKVNADNGVYITHNPKTINYKQKVEIKEYLSNQNLTEIPPLSYSVIECQNKKYMLHMVNYEYFSFGMLCDLDNLLKDMVEASGSSEEILCFVDKDGNVVAGDFQGKIELTNQEQTLKIDGVEQKFYVIYQPSSILVDYGIVKLVPSVKVSAEIPLLEKIILILGISSILLIPILIIVLYRLVIKPLNRINHAMQEIEQDNIDYRITDKLNSTEFEHVSHVFNNMAGQIQNLRIETYEKDIEKLDIEKTNLRLQINPHLLMNSLNMIYSLAQSKNYKCILDYTLLLVEYFRYTLRNTNDMVQIKQEIQFVQNFLEIQRIRFPEKFTCVYDVDEELEGILIPALIIENFVENSVKYALKMDDMIEIIIIVKSDGKKVSISVCDTGCGMSEDRLWQLKNGDIIMDRTGKHIGIWNCRRRLSLYYGEEATLSISSSEGSGTQVWMEFPITQGDKDEFTNRR